MRTAERRQAPQPKRAERELHDNGDLNGADSGNSDSFGGGGLWVMRLA